MDNAEEIIALFIDREKSKSVRLEELSDISRIYDDELNPFLVQVWIFSPQDDSLVPERRISLGKHRVVEAIDTFSLRLGHRYPLVVSVRFQKHEGFKEKWVIFYDRKISQFSLEETFTKQHRLEDIDGDGYKDVLLYEKIFEEGTGYETFITWYRWNGKRIVEHDTINVVRNLRHFLSEAQKLLIGEEFQTFLEYALRTRDVEKLQAQGLSAREILNRALRIRHPEEVDQGPLKTEEKEIVDIIYPEIMENPFAMPGENGARFPLQMRIITQQSNYLYDATVAMPENPFIGKQFYFVIPDNI
jgi:hypothetical protein